MSNELELKAVNPEQQNSDFFSLKENEYKLDVYKGKIIAIVHNTIIFDAEIVSQWQTPQAILDVKNALVLSPDTTYPHKN